MDRFEGYVDELVSAFPREVGRAEREFLESAAQGGFDEFRQVLLTLGWPTYLGDGQFLSHAGVSDEARLLFRMRYPWAANECKPRAVSHFSTNDVPASWLGAVLALCEDIREALLEADVRLLWLYALDQVKEKFGTLRWYDRIDLWTLDEGDGVLEGLWPDVSRRIDLAVALAEAVTGEICCSCGTSYDTWVARCGWIQVTCPSCRERDLHHGHDVDGILAELGTRSWPWGEGIFEDARRLDMAMTGFVPTRHKIAGDLMWQMFSVDGDERVDVVAAAEAAGVRHTLAMVRELDGKVDSDFVGIPDRGELVDRLRARLVDLGRVAVVD